MMEKRNFGDNIFTRESTPYAFSFPQERDRRLHPKILNGNLYRHVAQLALNKQTFQHFSSVTCSRLNLTNKKFCFEIRFLKDIQNNERNSQ